ncbi:MAG: ATP-binding protein, partial [Smithellaceae bacterium]
KIEGYLLDIDAYTRHEQMANDIDRQYETILAIEADKHMLAVQLGGSVKFAEIEKNDLADKLTLLTTEIHELSQKLHDLERQFQEKHDAVKSRLSVVQNELKKAHKYHADYQEMQIDAILARAEKKAFHEKSLRALQQEKDLLLQKAHHIEDAFNSQIAQLQQDQRELVFNLDRQKLDMHKDADQQIRAIDQHYQMTIQSKESSYQHTFTQSDERLDTVKETIRDLQLRKKDVQHSHPFQQQVQEFQNQVNEVHQTRHQHEIIVKENAGQIALAQKEIEYKEREGESKIEGCKALYQQQRLAAQEQLNAVLQDLRIADDSFLAFLETSYPDYKATIARVCRKELFSRTDLSPAIIDPNQLTFFGLNLDLGRLDSVILEREEYETQKRELEEIIRQLDEQFTITVNEIRQEVEQFIERQHNQIGKLNKAIATMTKEDRQHEFRIQQSRHQITVLQEKETKQKQQEIDHIDAQILDERDKQKKLQDERDQRQKHKAQELQALRDEQQKRRSSIEHDLQQKCNQLSQEQQQIEEDYKRRIADLETQKRHALLNEGVDVRKVEAIDQEIAAVEGEFAYIRKQESVIAVYQEHKREYIDKIPEFDQQKSDLTLKKRELTQHYQSAKEKLLTQQQQKEQGKIAQETRQQELQRGLEEFQQFKCSPLYAELVQQIEESFDETREDISYIIRQLYSKDQNFQRKRNILIENMTEFSGKFRPDNIFNFHFNRSGSGEYAFREFAQDIKEFVEEGQIDRYKREVNVHYGQLLRNLSKQFNDLNSKTGDIQKAITRINRDFERSNFVGAIKHIQLRFKESDNRIVNTLKHIAEFVSENPFAGEELNLFSPEPSNNQQQDRKAIDLLNLLRKNLENTSQQEISLEDSFKLEFRVVENENDTNFVEKLSRAGSEGTDILIKAMIYITLLDVAKEQFSKRIKAYKIHCIIDEVGKLASNYLKELIAFANSKDILLINGSPNIIDPLAYNTVYHVSKDSANNSIVKRLLAERQ